MDAVFALLYWCIDTAWGMQVLGVVLLSDFANGLFKLIFHAPRPYWIDARVKALSTETSYGIPSGHAQTGTAVWGLLATMLKRMFKKPWAVVAAAGLVLVVRAYIAGVADPPAWEAQAASAALSPPGRSAADPRSMDGLFVDLGVLFGAGTGLALMRRYAPFDPRGPWGKRLLRLALGLSVLVGLRSGLGAIFPREPWVVAMLFRYVRYALIGLWAIWLAPWVFLKIGLAESERRAAVSTR